MFRTLSQSLNRISTVHNALFIVFPKQGFIYDLADIGAVTRIIMNLQKLQTQRECHQRFIVRYLEKMEEGKEEDSMVEFNAIFAAIEGKVQILETLNDRILSQTDTDGTKEETFQTYDYSMELEIKLCRLRGFRGQQISECSSTHLEDRGNSGASDQQRNNNGLNPTAIIHPESLSSLTSSNSAQYYSYLKFHCHVSVLIFWILIAVLLGQL